MEQVSGPGKEACRRGSGGQSHRCDPGCLAGCLVRVVEVGHTSRWGTAEGAGDAVAIIGAASAAQNLEPEEAYAVRASSSGTSRHWIWVKRKLSAASAATASTRRTSAQS